MEATHNVCMRVDVTTQIEIARPCSQVAAYANQPDNAPEWYRNIRSVTWVTEPPLEVGSQFAFVAQFLGRRLAYTYEVVEYAVDQRFVMRTADGPFPMETTYQYEVLDDRTTRVTLRNRGEPAGFSRLVMPLMTRAMRHANRNDLACLKSNLEAGSQPLSLPD